MPPRARRTPQWPIGIPDRLHAQAIYLAGEEVLNEQDLIGRGLPVVVRRALSQYVKRNRDLLPDDLRD